MDYRRKNFTILRILIEDRGKVTVHEDLQTHLINWIRELSSRTVLSFVCAARVKFAIEPASLHGGDNNSGKYLQFSQGSPRKGRIGVPKTDAKPF